MRLVWYQVAIIFFTISITASGLNIVCGRSHRDDQCIADRIKVFNESEQLHFEYANKSLSDITHLQMHIKRSNLGFSLIPPSVFTIFPKLKELWIIHSNMTNLSPDNVKSAKKLETLGLRNCQISEVKPNTFNGFETMKYLNLKLNKLRFIERDTFAHLRTLSKLILTSNDIEVIDVGAFDLPQLITLDISGNKLTNLSDSLFSLLPKLKALLLSNNRLTHIGRSLYSLPNIANIALANNKIEDISLVEFAKIPTLYFLNLNGFSLKLQLTSDVENESLGILILADNNLKDLQDLNKLKMFKGVAELDLSGNSDIALGLPSINLKRILPKLQIVKLQRTNITCDQAKILTAQLNEQGIVLHKDEWCGRGHAFINIFSMKTED